MLIYRMLQDSVAKKSDWPNVYFFGTPITVNHRVAVICVLFFNEAVIFICFYIFFLKKVKNPQGKSYEIYKLIKNKKLITQKFLFIGIFCFIDFIYNVVSIFICFIASCILRFIISIFII